jgi:hypothetical protein
MGSDSGKDLPFDERIFSHPARFALDIVVLIVVLTALLVVGLSGNSPLPTVPPAGIVSDSLSGLLALGTLSLAYATGYMAQSVRLQAKSAERARQDQLAPHLSINLLEKRREESSGSAPRPVMVSPFFTRVEGERRLKFVVRNMGPGNAIQVRVECPAELVPGNGPWTGGDFPPVPELSSHSPRHVPVENRSLMANESYEFEITAAFPDPSTSGGASGTYKLLGRLCILAACKDVEGREIPTEQFRLSLQQIVPVAFRTGQDSLGDLVPHGRGYELLWSEPRARNPPEGAGWIPFPVMQ